MQLPQLSLFCVEKMKMPEQLRSRLLCIGALLNRCDIYHRVPGPAECRDAPECRRFHVGPTGCFLFATLTGPSKPVGARGGRVGARAWQAGAKLG